MSKKPGKRRWSLTLLYSTAFFLIQLAAVLITAALSFLLTKLGVLDNLGIPRNSGFAMLIVMLLISVLVGSVVAIGTVKIPLRPFNRLINNIDRLAAGDFTARMHYGKVMGDNPVFQELSESFNAMAEELENTQMLRSDFINNFSHEFKTPIVSIAGFAKLLRRGNLTDAQKEEYLAIIEEESLRLAAMATNVMNLTKVENQTILTDLTTFNLSEQIRACVLLLEEKWSRKELDLDLEFLEYTIRANEELLKVQKQQRSRHAAQQRRCPVCPRSGCRYAAQGKGGIAAGGLAGGEGRRQEKADAPVQPSAGLESLDAHRTVLHEGFLLLCKADDIVPVYSLSGKKSVANRIGGRNFCYPCIFAENPLNY